MGAHFGRRTASLPVSITSDVDHGQGCSVWAISASARTSERRSVVTTVTVNTHCYYTAKGYGDVVIFPGFHEDPARRAAVLQEHACEPKKGRVPGEDIVWHFCAGRSAPGGQEKVSLPDKRERERSQSMDWSSARAQRLARRPCCLSGWFLFGLGGWEGWRSCHGFGRRFAIATSEESLPVMGS